MTFSYTFESLELFLTIWTPAIALYYQHGFTIKLCTLLLIPLLYLPFSNSVISAILYTGTAEAELPSFCVDPLLCASSEDLVVNVK